MRQVTFSMLFSFLVIFVMCDASDETGNALPTVETIIARMAEARAENQACFRPYVVTRDYRLFGKDRERTKARVLADMTFTPPDAKKYAIRQATGSGLGKRIVRRTLAGEVDMAKDYALTDFSADNYDFRFTRAENIGGRCSYELELLPRREDKHLLRGSIWIDAATYLPRRVQGEPAKSPSWWLRNVNITLLYGEVSGMWLQTNIEATATVRILGPHTLISRDVEYRVTEPVAASCTPRESEAQTVRISSAPIHPSPTHQ
ncbi:MAG: hypothetical protein P8Z74_20455 [Acidobacteriota bacterium]